MKLKIILPSAMDVANTVFDEEKGELEMDLLFYGDGREGVGGVVQVIGEDASLLFRGVVKINGQTAKVSVADRTKQVKPLIEKKKKA